MAKFSRSVAMALRASILAMERVAPGETFPREVVPGSILEVKKYVEPPEGEGAALAWREWLERRVTTYFHEWGKVVVALRGQPAEDYCGRPTIWWEIVKVEVFRWRLEPPHCRAEPQLVVQLEGLALTALA